MAENNCQVVGKQLDSEALRDQVNIPDNPRTLWTVKWTITKRAKARTGSERECVCGGGGGCIIIF